MVLDLYKPNINLNPMVDYEVFICIPGGGSPDPGGDVVKRMVKPMSFSFTTTVVLDFYPWLLAYVHTRVCIFTYQDLHINEL